MSRLNDKVMNLIARGLIEAVDDEGGVQVVSMSLLSEEKRSKVERIQNYGFTSQPRIDAEAIAIFPGGDRSAGIVVALDDRSSRLAGLKTGEVAMYSDEGDSVVLTRNRTLEINTRIMLVRAEEKVRFETPLVETTGDIVDNCDTQPTSVRSLRDAYVPHRHTETGGITNPPDTLPVGRVANDNV